MFSKNLLIATIVATIFFFGVCFLWYVVLMGDFYQHIDGVNRNPVNYPLIILGFLAFSYAFCRIYQLVYDSNKPVMGQAINYGVLVGLLYIVSHSLIQYATRIMPMNEMLIDIIFNVIVIILTAIIVSKIFGTQIDRGDGGRGGGDD